MLVDRSPRWPSRVLGAHVEGRRGGSWARGRRGPLVEGRAPSVPFCLLVLLGGLLLLTPLALGGPSDPLGVLGLSDSADSSEVVLAATSLASRWESGPDKGFRPVPLVVGDLPSVYAAGSAAALRADARRVAPRPALSSRLTRSPPSP